MSKSLVIGFFPKNPSLEIARVNQCWNGKLRGTISRGTDVETKWFLLTKKGKSTQKLDNYHQILLWGFSEKGQFFFCS